MKRILRASKNIAQKIYCPEQVFLEPETEENQFISEIPYKNFFEIC